MYNKDKHEGRVNALNLYDKIYKEIKADIISGSLLPGERLPSKRMLSLKEGVSLNTVMSAYDMLLKDGLIRSVERSGYYVTGEEDKQSFSGDPWSVPSEKRYVFSINSNGISKLSAKLIRAMHDTEYSISDRLLSYKEYTGNAALRESICEYLYKTRHIRCSSEQIITASGQNELMGIIARLLGDDTVYAFEDPTEKKMIYSLTGGKGIKPVKAGISGAELSELKISGADVFFCMPEKQYPIGYKTDLDTRRKLLDWCGDDKYIIEYGLYAEYSFGEPVPSLYELDGGKRVIYVNTFDKVTAPGISLAYMVLPQQLVGVFKERLWFHHSNISEYDSLVITEYIANGGIYSNIRRMKKLYKKKCDAALQAWKDTPFVEKLSFIGTDNAAFFAVAVSTDKSGEELMAKCSEADVKLLPVSCYELNHNHHSTVFAFGYAEMSEPEIREGIRRIGNAWEKLHL